MHYKKRVSAILTCLLLSFYFTIAGDATAATITDGQILLVIGEKIDINTDSLGFEGRRSYENSNTHVLHIERKDNQTLVLEGMNDGLAELSFTSTAGESRTYVVIVGNNTQPEYDSNSVAFATRKAEIEAKWKQLAPNYTGSPYDVKPSSSAPYSIGKLNSSALKDANNMLNFVRFLSDLPDDVVFTDALNQQCQYGSVLLAANGALSHRPTKPSDMPQDFYQKGYDNCGASNLHSSSSYRDDTSVSDYIASFMDDSDPSNIDRVGHRRWIINPAMLYSGVGLAQNSKSKESFNTLYAFDASRTQSVAYEAVRWPNGSAFPTAFFDGHCAWSVSLNPAIYQTPNASEVKVTLTNDAGKSWSFSQNNKDVSGRFFNIDTGGYGIANCIIFRPEGVSSYEGTYSVSISGLKKIDGSNAQMQYSVTFFALDEKVDEDPGEEETPQKTTASSKKTSTKKVSADYDGDGKTDYTYSIPGVIKTGNATMAKSLKNHYEDAFRALAGKKLPMYTIKVGEKIDTRGAINTIYFALDYEKNKGFTPKPYDEVEWEAIAKDEAVVGKSVDYDNGYSYSLRGKGSYTQFLKKGYYIFTALPFDSAHYYTNIKSENWGELKEEMIFAYNAVVLHVVE